MAWCGKAAHATAREQPRLLPFPAHRCLACVARVCVHLLLQGCQHGLQLLAGLEVAVPRHLLLVSHLRGRHRDTRRDTTYKLLE